MLLLENNKLLGGFALGHHAPSYHWVFSCNSIVQSWYILNLLYIIRLQSKMGNMNILMHPVILNVAMEGYLVTDVDVDGITLNAFLLVLLLFWVEVQSGGSAPLSRCPKVRRRLHINGLFQGLCILFSLCKHISGLYTMFVAVIRWRCVGGAEQEEVEEPQNWEEEASLCQKTHFPWPAHPHRPGQGWHSQLPIKKPCSLGHNRTIETCIIHIIIQRNKTPVRLGQRLHSHCSSHSNL